MSICRYCKKNLKGPAEGGIEGIDYIMRVSKYYYHPYCFSLWEKSMGGDTNNNVKGDNKFWQDITFNYLKLSVQMDVNFFMFKKQWDNYLQQGKRAKGIYLTLRYFYDIKKGDKNKANGGIGIVEYVYDEAGKYWVEQQEKNEKIILELERQIEIQRETWLSSPKKLVKTKKNKNKKFNLDEVENG